MMDEIKTANSSQARLLIVGRCRVGGNAEESGNASPVHRDYDKYDPVIEYEESKKIWLSFREDVLRVTTGPGTVPGLAG
jgi:hypothetical protein